MDIYDWARPDWLGAGAVGEPGVSRGSARDAPLLDDDDFDENFGLGRGLEEEALAFRVTAAESVAEREDVGRRVGGELLASTRADFGFRASPNDRNGETFRFFARETDGDGGSGGGLCSTPSEESEGCESVVHLDPEFIHGEKEDAYTLYISMTSGQSGSGPPVVRPVVNRPSTNSILVNRRQEKNPLLELLRNVAWEYAAISPDFQVGATTCALFLSLRYHRLHPEYVHRRISDLGHSFTLRIMIFLVDAKDPENEIKELTKICLINGLTIMAAWSLDEVAQYLTTYKAYENKSPNMIMEHIDQDYPSILRSALTSIKGVNKTDVTTLRTRFGDFASMSHATFDELNLCPGFGKVKARRVKDAFDKPFYPGRTGPVGGSQLKGKGKEREQDDQFMSEPIEEQGNDGGGSKGALDDPARGFSPDWDIDLDLNESDHEDEEGSGNTIQIQSPSPHPPSTKKKKPNPVVRSEWD